MHRRTLTNWPAGRGIDPAASTTPVPKVAAVQLPTRTVAWLADHPPARKLVCSVWDTLAELERAGHHPGAIDALRRVLTCHQPNRSGRCRTCRRRTWHGRVFPCVVWHQIRGELLDLFAGGGRDH